MDVLGVWRGMNVFKRIASSIYEVFGMIIGEGLNDPADQYLAKSPYLRSYFS